MAAAARPPGIGDARVPCPLCGGLIHPVAGRCKHCKEDLSTLRAGRPQAAAVLPALNGKAGQPAAAPVAGNGTSVHAGPVAAAPVAIPARDGSAPILPQRVTGRDMEAARPRRILENWPLIVIVLAVIAIVTAVVIMVLPASSAARGGKKGLLAPPAPDRMETSPLPEKSSQADPWQSGPAPNAAPDPQQPTPPDPQPRATPDPPRQPDPNSDPDDLFGNLGGGSAFDQMLQSMNGTFALTMLNAACTKLQSCPGTSGGTVAMMCSSLTNFPHPALPANCPSARRCMEAIDKMDCNSSLATGTDPFAAMMLVQDCATAATQC